ncbi:unnamed protein product, partial [Rotaria sordida]
PLHMKKNIPFTMLFRAIKYCSTFQTYLDEREKLRMALLLNRYPNKIIEQQFNNVLLRFNIDQPLTTINYDKYRQNVLDSPYIKPIGIDYDKVMFIHFTYCSSMKGFPLKFHTIWNKYFGESPINEIRPILGTRNLKEKRQELANKLLAIFNQMFFFPTSRCFSSQLPDKISVIWSGRLIATAGHCTTRRTTRTAVITLSHKVSDSLEYCGDTLLHEMCHAAVVLTDGVMEHGQC